MRRLQRRFSFSLGLCAVLAVGTAWAGDPAVKAEMKGYRQELKALEKVLFHRNVVLREDVTQHPKNTKAQGVTETVGGQLYARADPAVLYEALGTVQLVDPRLRGPETLLVIVYGMDAIPRTEPVLVTLNPRQAGGVRAAVRELVYLPGDQATQEEIQSCLDRYPDHDETLSRDRCSLRWFEQHAGAGAR